MNPLASCVSLHPYFKVHEGQLDAFRSLMDRFVERTATEERVLFYGFTVNGNEVFCREGYLGAEGILTHLENVGQILAEGLKIAELARLEIHGPREELEKLREPLAHLPVAWFIYETGLVR